MKHAHHEEVTSTCESCGASIYQAHLDSGIARYEGGKLLCAHCVAEYEKSHDAVTGGGAEDFAPIELEGDVDKHLAPAKDMQSSRIHAVSAATLGHAGAWDESRFKRKCQRDGGGAIRCRTFHCRLSEGAVEFMTGQINEWLDNNPDIVVKFSNSVIGQFEGKHTEPNLILTVFY
jgi:hypothetical protein